jgi:hypothetical protein
MCGSCFVLLSDRGEKEFAPLPERIKKERLIERAARQKGKDNDRLSSQVSWLTWLLMQQKTQEPWKVAT